MSEEGEGKTLVDWKFTQTEHDYETGEHTTIKVSGGSGKHDLATALGLFVRLLRGAGYAINTEEMVYQGVPFDDWYYDPEGALRKVGEYILDKEANPSRPPYGFAGVVKNYSNTLNTYHCRDED